MATSNGTNTGQKFALGRLVATPGALEALGTSGETALPYLARHRAGDWGEVCDEDKRLNDEAVAHEGDPDRQSRVLSAYRTTGGVKLWVITEWDRSVTTLLLPDEY